MQDWSVWRHAFFGGQDWFENLIDHFYQLGRFLGYVGADSGDRSYRVTFIKGLAPGQNIHAQEAQVMYRTLGQVGELH